MVGQDGGLPRVFDGSHFPEDPCADCGYDSQPHRRALRKRHTTPVLARCNTPHGSGLGVYRWVIKLAESWVHQDRHLKLRYDRRDDMHEAFVALACALICLNRLRERFC